MTEKLIEILENLGLEDCPVCLQGTLNPEEEYPDHFFTFWNSSTASKSFYNNVEHAVDWEFNVNFYSTEAAEIADVLNMAKEALRKGGFIVRGAGRDVPSGVSTHTGRGLNVLAQEREE